MLNRACLDVGGRDMFGEMKDMWHAPVNEHQQMLHSKIGKEGDLMHWGSIRTECYVH